MTEFICNSPKNWSRKIKRKTVQLIFQTKNNDNSYREPLSLFTKGGGGLGVSKN